MKNSFYDRASQFHRKFSSIDLISDITNRGTTKTSTHRDVNIDLLAIADSYSECNNLIE